MLAQTESVFALSNGHIGLRGNLDEGEPHGLPGTYLNGVYELRPLPYAEAGYGYPESGQTVINVTNGKLIRLLVDDEPFDVRYGQLRAPRAGARPARRGAAPRRASGSRRPGGRCGCARPGWCRSSSARSRRSRYEVEAVDDPMPGGRAVRAGRQRAAARRPTAIPRVAAALEAPLAAEEHAAAGHAGCVLVHRTRHSGLRVAAGDGPRRRRAAAAPTSPPRAPTTSAGCTVTATLRARAAAAAGQVRRLRLVRRPLAARGARPGRRGAGRGARRPAGTGLLAEQRGVPRRLLGPAPTSRSTATPRSSRRCGSRCSTCCRPAPGPRSGRSRPRA